VSRTTSESPLRLLFGLLENTELHARFRWQPGTLAIWDSRRVQHASERHAPIWIAAQQPGAPLAQRRMPSLCISAKTALPSAV
jgi:hypothetical protein